MCITAAVYIYVCVPRCGVGVCNSSAMCIYGCYAAALVCVMLLCICVLRCGVGVCNAAVYMCAALRHWCV